MVSMEDLFQYFNVKCMFYFKNLIQFYFWESFLTKIDELNNDIQLIFVLKYLCLNTFVLLIIYVKSQWKF